LCPKILALSAGLALTSKRLRLVSVPNVYVVRALHWQETKNYLTSLSRSSQLVLISRLAQRGTATRSSYVYCMMTGRSRRTVGLMRNYWQHSLHLRGGTLTVTAMVHPMRPKPHCTCRCSPNWRGDDGAYWLERVRAVESKLRARRGSRRKLPIDRSK